MRRGYVLTKGCSESVAASQPPETPRNSAMRDGGWIDQPHSLKRSGRMTRNLLNIPILSLKEGTMRSTLALD